MALSSADVLSQCGGHGDHGGTGGHNHAAYDDSHEEHLGHHNHLPSMGSPTWVQRTPHGGLFLETASHCLEVVYLPGETRVYLYGKSMEPLRTLSLRGEVSPQVRGESDRRTIPLQHMSPSGPKEQDYLVAVTDVSQLPDETPITFRFENLPDRRHPRAEFTPVFSRSQIRPYVARVSFVQTDRDGLTQQQTCPVTGTRLGSMGQPIKVLIGERPLYLCCEGCMEKVQETVSTGRAQSLLPSDVRKGIDHAPGEEFGEHR